MSRSSLEILLNTVQTATQDGMPERIDLPEDDELLELGKSLNELSEKVIEKNRKIDELEKQVEGLKEDAFWRAEELKAKNQEFEEYANLLDKQKIKLEIKSKEIEEKQHELEVAFDEHQRLQDEVIEPQRQAIRELSTPIIPIMDRIMIMPLIGDIDTIRARDILRALLEGVRVNRAKIVILDVTGVPLVDSGVANHLNRAIQAVRLKGARTIITGISDAVAETIVDLGIEWGEIETLADLQSGLVAAVRSLKDQPL